MSEPKVEHVSNDLLTLRDGQVSQHTRSWWVVEYEHPSGVDRARHFPTLAEAQEFADKQRP